MSTDISAEYPAIPIDLFKMYPELHAMARQGVADRFETDPDSFITAHAYAQDKDGALTVFELDMDTQSIRDALKRELPERKAVVVVVVTEVVSNDILIQIETPESPIQVEGQRVMIGADGLRVIGEVWRPVNIVIPRLSFRRFFPEQRGG